MTAEGPRRCKLTQFVSYHILGDKNFHMNLAIVYQEGVADEFGNDRTGPSPGFDRFLCAQISLLFYFAKEFGVDIRAFF